jgi:hypothetical protein
MFVSCLVHVDTQVPPALQVKVDLRLDTNETRCRHVASYATDPHLTFRWDQGAKKVEPRLKQGGIPKARVLDFYLSFQYVAFARDPTKLATATNSVTEGQERRVETLSRCVDSMSTNDFYIDLSGMKSTSNSNTAIESSY